MPHGKLENVDQWAPGEELWKKKVSWLGRMNSADSPNTEMAGGDLLAPPTGTNNIE